MAVHVAFSPSLDGGGASKIQPDLLSRLKKDTQGRNAAGDARASGRQLGLSRPLLQGESIMAEEDTRKLLRTFGVTVTNFEARTAQFLEQAKQLHRSGDPERMLPLLRDFARELLDLQGRWLEITNHVLSQQRQVLTEIATLISEWEQRP
jgi:hypothetical protein